MVAATHHRPSEPAGLVESETKVSKPGRLSPLVVKEDPAPLTVRERLREAASWNLVATKLEIAGAQARKGPAIQQRVAGARERRF
jgi:hypothetical protein